MPMNSCILCSKTFSKIDLKYDPNLNKLIRENPDKCLDCLKKIYAIQAIDKLKQIMSIKLFNEKTLLSKVNNPDIYITLLSYLKKEEIIKKFGNNNDFYMINGEKDLETYENIYTKFLNGKNYHVKNVSDNSLNPMLKKPTTLKTCKFCKKNLPIKDFNKNDQYYDGLSENCIKCNDKKNNAAFWLKEIMRYVKLDQPFSTDFIYERSVKLPSSIKRNLNELKDLGLLEQNKPDKKYIVRVNDKLNAFCDEYNISLNIIESIHAKDTEINIKNIEDQIELLNNNKCDIRRTAANKLGDIGDDRAIKPLINALKD